MIEPNTLYWFGGRTFAPVVIGRKKVTGLVIEADGLHTLALSKDDTRLLRPVNDYPWRKVRGFIRKRRPTTKQSKTLRKRLLQKV